MDWQGLGIGFAFYLILEGILPLMNPQGLKQTLLQILQVSENTLRIFGAISICCGVLLLYAIK